MMDMILNYDSAGDFCEDLAKIGYIDKTGQMVIEYKTEPSPAPARFSAPDDELPF